MFGRHFLISSNIKVVTLFLRIIHTIFQQSENNLTLKNAIDHIWLFVFVFSWFRRMPIHWMWPADWHDESCKRVSRCSPFVIAWLHFHYRAHLVLCSGLIHVFYFCPSSWYFFHFYRTILIFHCWILIVAVK